MKIKTGKEIFEVIHSAKHCIKCADNHKLRVRTLKNGEKRATCPTCGTRYIIRERKEV